LVRGAVRRDVPIPPERPYDLGIGQPSANADAASLSYGRASQAYASVSDARPSAYRAAGYAPIEDNSTANPISGRGLY